ncbi:MAG: RAMP superfamily CRISPR-associated protein [Anaerolineae bacterium]|jgi:CRISPR/Cas system CSM-associated protein Csm3 (group 7 of RAMP superfamily)|nr:RAMP superfamily CRISPR-associated protein [Anaerolineae bacterium]
MSDQGIQGRAARGIVERIIIQGALVLETPANLGNGDADALTDMPLLLDEVSEKPLLTGTSIAGALRAYQRELEHGYSGRERPHDRARQLFGEVRGNESVQSWVLVNDALGVTPGIEVRDGVTLDPATRTAVDKKKYDYELLQAGTTFDVSLELLLPEGESGKTLLQSLAWALQGFEKGEIGLGLRKHRGLGQCKVTAWRVRHYVLTTPAGLLAWLENDPSSEKTGAAICDLLGVNAAMLDQRARFTLKAEFGLASSLLIRSGGGVDDPDMVQLQSLRGRKPVPILSGTSLAGAVRARALRIANTMLGEPTAKKLMDDMFGKAKTSSAEQPTGSRVLTRETEVVGNLDLVQSRVKIDRFTGGAYPQALFSEQPLWGGPKSKVTVELELRDPKPAEIGLLLLVLKDLWTGDLPLGGESGVGRGRLAGREATLAHVTPQQTREWILTQGEGDTLNFSQGKPEELEAFVEAFLARKEDQQ